MPYRVPGQLIMCPPSTQPGHPIYRLDPGPLAPLADWLAGLATADRWERHLDALETEIYRTRRERRARGPVEHRREHTA
ncbi:hypothetical protein ABZU25_10550 [Micromonospora sp. NPDC005215]|uniref:hypothetical protein n=1 Tax=Micromonospora sp. NPDC005215 TaxID=3157024 RepID=UPI0033A90A9F